MFEKLVENPGFILFLIFIALGIISLILWVVFSSKGNSHKSFGGNGESWSDFKRKRVRIALLLPSRDKRTIAEEQRQRILGTLKNSLSVLEAQTEVVAPNMNVPRPSVLSDCRVVALLKVFEGGTYEIEYYSVSMNGTRKRMEGVKKDTASFSLNDRSKIIKNDQEFRQKFGGFMAACFRASR